MATLLHRKFAPPAASIADEWFVDPICRSDVVVTGVYSCTADGACPVILPDGHIAFVKPRPDADKKLVVAREKIASDLAHLVGLPVAPVAIRNPDPANGWEHFTAISLACLPAGRLWQDGGNAHLAAAAEALEALRVFWSWIGDCDHDHHGGNLLYEVHCGGACAVAAIDHSYALCHGNNIHPLAVAASAGYGTKGLTTVEQACRDTVMAIQGADWQHVIELTKRLDSLLTVDEQDRIISILQARRDQLPVMLGL